MPAAKYTQWITPDGMHKIRTWVKEGKSDAEIAGLIGTTPSVLSTWRRSHPEIRAALIRPMERDGHTIDKHDLYTCGPQRKLNAVEKVQNIIDTWKEQRKADGKKLTLPSLLLALNITREQLDQYLNERHMKSAIPIEDQFTREITHLTISDVLQKALIEIENDIADLMIDRNSVGAIFALKNWRGYADKKDIGVISGASSSALTTSELDARLQYLLDKSRDGQTQ